MHLTAPNWSPDKLPGQSAAAAPGNCTAPNRKPAAAGGRCASASGRSRTSWVVLRLVRCERTTTCSARDGARKDSGGGGGLDQAGRSTETDSRIQGSAVRSGRGGCRDRGGI